MKKIILEIKNKRYYLEPINENALSAKRVLRRVLKQVIDEYRRNTKNGEVFAILAQVIMSLKKYMKTVESLEHSFDYMDAPFDTVTERNEKDHPRNQR